MLAGFWATADAEKIRRKASTANRDIQAENVKLISISCRPRLELLMPKNVSHAVYLRSESPAESCGNFSSSRRGESTLKCAGADSSA
jgi:hypothetical protein